MSHEILWAAENEHLAVTVYEEIVFASGAVLANFASEPVTVEGITVPAGGFVLRS